MTTQTQFETAACPPTPVRRLEPDEDTKTLLVPTDFSRGSRHAAQTAVTLARAIGARIEFLHVRNVAEFVGSLPMGGMPDFHAMDALRPEDTEAMWQRFLFATDGLDQVDYERRTSIGHPVSAILARADELDAEMIVMGASRCPRLLRWMFPDTTKHVVARASCSVVVVDPDRTPMTSHRTPDAPATRVGELDDRYPAQDALPAWVPTPSFC